MLSDGKLAPKEEFSVVDASNMKTLSIISRKGGVEKTTFGLYLVVSWSGAERNVAILNLNPQVSAEKWSDRREVELPVMLSARASRLDPEIERISRTCGEAFVLDTAP